MQTQCSKPTIPYHPPEDLLIICCRPNANGIDHLVTAFIETTPAEQFKPTTSSLRQPTTRDETHRWCSRCGFTLPIAQFMAKSNGTVARSTCRDCTNETYREQYGSRTGATQ